MYLLRTTMVDNGAILSGGMLEVRPMTITREPETASIVGSSLAMLTRSENHWLLRSRLLIDGLPERPHLDFD
jgi:hypothetical protein